eukprot:CAMPEP_0177775660 /NCGR_PEP_ID=MMETSP0491_2-20121128/14245_1 /TAXON_ID=63592 /ORGANISM="Tetraselmis chuii, Strain PLY429" /LENGTH=658 /DNA_ID=CAMNT_0019294293 /DNA_START=708 /DNA_END=2684 /DNA_ORIENTATION=-
MGLLVLTGAVGTLKAAHAVARMVNNRGGGKNHRPPSSTTLAMSSPPPLELDNEAVTAPDQTAANLLTEKHHLCERFEEPSKGSTTTIPDDDTPTDFCAAAAALCESCPTSNTFTETTSGYVTKSVDQSIHSDVVGLHQVPDEASQLLRGKGISRTVTAGHSASSGSSIEMEVEALSSVDLWEADIRFASSRQTFFSERNVRVHVPAADTLEPAVVFFESQASWTTSTDIKAPSRFRPAEDAADRNFQNTALQWVAEDVTLSFISSISRHCSLPSDDGEQRGVGQPTTTHPSPAMQRSNSGNTHIMTDNLTACLRDCNIIHDEKSAATAVNGKRHPIMAGMRVVALCDVDRVDTTAVEIHRIMDELVDEIVAGLQMTSRFTAVVEDERGNPLQGLPLATELGRCSSVTSSNIKCWESSGESRPWLEATTARTINAQGLYYDSIPGSHWGMRGSFHGHLCRDDYSGSAGLSYSDVCGNGRLIDEVTESASSTSDSPSIVARGENRAKQRDVARRSLPVSALPPLSMCGSSVGTVRRGQLELRFNATLSTTNRGVLLVGGRWSEGSARWSPCGGPVWHPYCGEPVNRWLAITIGAIASVPLVVLLSAPESARKVAADCDEVRSLIEQAPASLRRFWESGRGDGNNGKSDVDAETKDHQEVV